MKSQWLNDIAGGNVELLQMFRSEDVATLEGKCPSLIRKDYEFIFDEILAGRLFKNIDSESLSGVQERLFSIDSTILSFGTFLRDANILECYASCLLHVLPSKRDCTITSQLWKAFQPADHNYEFIADLPSYDSNDTAFTKARQRLWIFAMQHYLELPRPPQRRDSRLRAKPPRISPVNEVLESLEALVEQLGFQLPVNTKGRANTPLAARADIILTSRSIHDNSSCEVDFQYRLGFQDKESYSKTKPLLTMERLNRTGPESQRLTTSFIVLRSKYRAFFCGQVPSFPRIRRPKMTASIAQRLVSGVRHELMPEPASNPPAALERTSPERTPPLNEEQDRASSYSSDGTKEKQDDDDSGVGSIEHVLFMLRSGEVYSQVQITTEKAEEGQTAVEVRARALQDDGYSLHSILPQTLEGQRIGYLNPEQCYEASLRSKRRIILLLKADETAVLDEMFLARIKAIVAEE